MVSKKTQHLPQHAKELLEQPGISDGSELIPAEVEARMKRQGDEVLHLPKPKVEQLEKSPESYDTTKGYTSDQEGLVNSYPVTPPIYLQKQTRVGFTEFAEMVNGRSAMVGFVVLLLIELIAGKSFIAILTGS